ncbi:MAG: hypothetical protein LBN24_04095 [Mediterranea sp.]|jgi:hypothetical protein|nr:hypothetical protein [Mediterranea sp.]
MKKKTDFTLEERILKLDRLSMSDQKSLLGGSDGVGIDSTTVSLPPTPPPPKPVTFPPPKPPKTSPINIGITPSSATVGIPVRWP